MFFFVSPAIIATKIYTLCFLSTLKRKIRNQWPQQCRTIKIESTDFFNTVPSNRILPSSFSRFGIWLKSYFDFFSRAESGKHVSENLGSNESPAGILLYLRGLPKYTNNLLVDRDQIVSKLSHQMAPVTIQVLKFSLETLVS